VAIRRSVLLIKAMGEGQRLEVGPPKSGRSRMVDLDDRTLAALTVHRGQLRALSPLLAQDDAYVLGRLDGGVQHPERLSRSFAEHRQSAAARYGIELPAIRLHDLRHTHATLYLRAGIDSKIVSEGLGHANVSITLDVYSHAVPSLQREAAAQVATLVYGAPV
jgi:integrase